MRRKVGVSAVNKKKEDLNAFTAVGKQSKDQKIAFVKETLTSFQTSLAEFAMKYKDKINADPEFRQQFHKMCSNIGVDPLASNKGFWADILGVGDYYYELGVAISHICLKTRHENGGIISIAELVKLIRNSGVAARNKTTIEDIQRAVQKLSVLGNGFRTITIANKLMIVSVPTELNIDHERLLSLGQEYGYVTESIVVSRERWTIDRFQLVIQSLLREGMVWVDDGDTEEHRYMFPSLWIESRVLASQSI